MKTARDAYHPFQSTASPRVAAAMCGQLAVARVLIGPWSKQLPNTGQLWLPATVLLIARTAAIEFCAHCCLVQVPAPSRAVPLSRGKSGHLVNVRARVPAADAKSLLTVYLYCICPYAGIEILLQSAHPAGHVLAATNPRSLLPAVIQLLLAQPSCHVSSLKYLC